LIAAVILAAAAAVFFFQVKNRTSGTVYAIVEQDSKELMRLPLSEPGEYRISDGDSYNVIEITEGGVRMKEADCPDQICVSRGRDSAGAVRYAVGVVGMFDCVRSPAFQRDIDLTCAAAAQISTALGYRA